MGVSAARAARCEPLGRHCKLKGSGNIRLATGRLGGSPKRRASRWGETVCGALWGFERVRSGAIPVSPVSVVSRVQHGDVDGVGDDLVSAEDAGVRETLTHRLVLPRDANHYGTLYAGTLLSLALEAGYATAYRSAGAQANLVLKRVLDLRCYVPVPVGNVVAIRGAEVHRASAQVIVALWGIPLAGHFRPWMDSLMQFVQVDERGLPEPLDAEPPEVAEVLDAPWSDLRARARKLLSVRM